jgi:hypothetical protein
MFKVGSGIYKIFVLLLASWVPAKVIASHIQFLLRSLNRVSFLDVLALSIWRTSSYLNLSRYFWCLFCLLICFLNKSRDSLIDSLLGSLIMRLHSNIVASNFINLKLQVSLDKDIIINIFLIIWWRRRIVWRNKLILYKVSEGISGILNWRASLFEFFNRLHEIVIFNTSDRCSCWKWLWGLLRNDWKSMFSSFFLWVFHFSEKRNCNMCFSHLL